MDNANWTPENWSVFMQPVRTNNDVEGWHRRLNARAGRPKLQFYLLIELLYSEASFVTIQTRLLSTGKLRRYQRKSYKKMQGQIFQMWREYNEGNLSVSKLLKRAGGIYAPTVIRLLD